MFTELDVVNEMLSTMGAVPLNGLSEDNPDVANCRRILDLSNKSIQGKGWWFNKEEIDLIADAVSGMIYIPNDTLSCDPACERGQYQVVVRERRLYDTNKNTFLFTPGTKIKCRLTRLIPFGELPVQAQRLVMVSAVMKFQQSYDADDFKTQQLAAEYQQAYINLNAEHTRNFNSSLLYKKSTVHSLNRINGLRGW